jgi:Skp family chaperone for outer membrane proteins
MMKRHSFTIFSAIMFSIAVSGQDKKSVPPPPKPEGAALGSATAAPASSAHAPFATINVQQAVFGSSEGKDRVAALSKEFAPRQADLKAQNDAIQSLKNAQGNANEIAAKQSALDAAVKAYSEEGQSKQQAIAQDILKKMAPTIVKFGGDQGYGAIFDTSKAWPESNIVWWAGPADITKAIVESYDGNPAAATGTANETRFALINMQQAIAGTDEAKARLSGLTTTGQTDLQAGQQVIFKEILQKMAPNIVKFASDHGYSALLDVSKSWPQSTVVWWDSSLDVTNSIIQGYNGLSSPSATPAASGKSYAIINIEHAIFITHEGLQRYAALQKEYEPMQAELQTRKAGIDKLKAASGNQNEILTKQREFEAAAKAANDDWQAKQQAIAQDVLQKMAPGITKYAQDHGYGVLIDSSQQWPRSNLLWYGPAVDITQAVVDNYDGPSRCDRLDVVRVEDDARPTGPGHCAGEADFWFTNTSVPVDCAIMFHKNGRFDPASIQIFSLLPNEKRKEVSACGADSGEMQYQCFSQSGHGGSNSCIAGMKWRQ